MCCLSIDSKTQAKFCILSRGEVIEVKISRGDKNDEIVVMVCCDEEFVEDVQITKENWWNLNGTWIGWVIAYGEKIYTANCWQLIEYKNCIRVLTV